MKKILSIFGIVLTAVAGISLYYALATGGTTLINQTASSTITGPAGFKKIATDTSLYNNLNLSFDYDIRSLEPGDFLDYGYNIDTGAAKVQSLGSIEGETGTTSSSEVGHISISIPYNATSSNSNFSLVFRLLGNPSNLDNAIISNVVLTGDLISTSTVDNTAPSTPANFATTSVTSNSIGLTWDPSIDTGSGIAYYSVGYKLQSSASTTIATTTNTNFTISGLTAFSTYILTVAAFDNAGNVSGIASLEETTLAAATTSSSTLFAPNLYVSNLTSTSFVLHWNDVSGATSYEVFKDGASYGSTTSTSSAITGLTASTSYAMFVVATDGTNFATSSTLTETTDPISSGGGGGSGSGTTTPSLNMIIVKPGDLHGWTPIDDNGNGGSADYVNGPATAPLGSGSLEISVATSGEGYLVALPQYGGTKLSDISTIDYSTYVQSGNNTIAPSIQLNITKDVTDSNLGWQGRLVYEPYLNGTVTDNQWQTWNAVNGKWWLSKASTLFNNNCSQSNPCTFSQLIALYPNIGINLGTLQAVGFKAGSGWTNFTGNVDDFHVITTTVNDEYDFEPILINVCTNPTQVVTTDLSTWDLSETRATGHNQIVSNGLHIWTEGNTSTDKAAGYFVTNFDLKDLGTNNISDTINYITNSGSIAPSSQLVVDFNNDGTPDGILVGETIYGNNWWLSNSAQQFVKDNAPNTGGGNGSNWFGTAEEWLNRFPNAKVLAIGYSLGSGVLGDYTITKIVAGCKEYTFETPAPSAPINLVWLNSTNHSITSTNVDLITPSWSNPTTTPEPIASYDYSYSKDGGLTWSSPENLGNITSIPNQAFGTTPKGIEAPWVFRVRSVGDNDKTSDWSTSSIINYDITDPIVTFTWPNAGSHVSTNNDLTVTGTYSDNLSGIDHIMLYLSPGNGYSYNYNYYYHNTHPDYGYHYALGIVKGNASGTFNYTFPAQKLQELGVVNGGQFTVTAVPFDQAGNGSTVRDNLVLNSDTAAPAITTILTPGERQWFRITPINDSWNPITKDINGNPEQIDHYQVAYQYDDGHTFGDSTCSATTTINGKWVGCRDVNGTSRGHQPGPNEEGGVTIWVRGIDKAGNIGGWSPSVHYYYDHTIPFTTISVSPVVNGKFTVSGTSTDNLALNRVYLQLLNSNINARCGGFLFNLITSPFSTSSSWSKQYDISSIYNVNATSSLCGSGTYSANANVVDMAGNTYNPGWTSSFVLTMPDTNPPAKPLLVSPANNSVVNGASITQVWSDSSDDVDHYIYESYNNSTASSLRFHGEYSTTSKTATNVSDTNYWWRVKAVDSSNNQSVWSDLWKITVDNIKPVAQITSATQTDDVEAFSGYITDINLNYYYCWLTKKNDSTEIGGTRNSNCVTTWANGATNFGSSTSSVELGGFDVSDLESGDYTIHLIAVDKANNKSNESTYDVNVTSNHGGDGEGEGDENNSPIASFIVDNSNDPTILFTNTSTDTDGTISDLNWDFGDGNSALGLNPSHTYTSNGNYNVVLTVADNDGATSSTSTNISITGVEENGGGGGGNPTSTPQTFSGGSIFIPPQTTTNGGNGSVLGATAYQFTQNLKLGSIGDEVKALQKFLNLKGFKLAETGPGSLGQETNYFGYMTWNALKTYQEANPSILTNVGITNGVGTGNFFWSTRGFVNNILLNDNTTSEALSQN